LVRRFLAALSAATEEGMLYDVDMKLRPSGSKGPWAVSRAAFETYYAQDAWTWESMALLKARVVAGPDAFRAEIRAAIDRVLVRPRDRAKLVADVADMLRRIDETRIEAQGRAGNPFDVKHVRGGLAEFDFILALLALGAAAKAGAPPSDAPGLVAWLAAAGVLDAEESAFLSSACGLYRTVLQLGRAATGGAIEAATAGSALSARLAEATGTASLEEAAARLVSVQAEILRRFERHVGEGGGLAQ
ncbi:MAG: hypothetical protein K2Q06_10215, partial [Parvularculaceae bacterium]|nr:hypothetical protein [Parvularculaceae bacterium]